MSRIRKLATSALIIALAYVLSFVKIFHLPFGGSITAFSMLFIALPSYFFGIRIGFVASFAFSLLKLIIDPYIIHPMQLLLDYTFAYTCFGIAGLFRNKENGLHKGYILACIIRFLSSSLSGYIFFSEYAPEAWNPLLYTVVYNGSYIFIECIITIIFISIKQVHNFIEMFKMRCR